MSANWIAPGKIAFLQSLDLMSVPTVYHESKGNPVLEALANGVPVVLPRHGTFPEMIETTGAGLLCEPLDPAALADALAELILDPSRAADHGRRGHEAIRRHAYGRADGRAAPRTLSARRPAAVEPAAVEPAAVEPAEIRPGRVAGANGNAPRRRRSRAGEWLNRRRVALSVGRRQRGRESISPSSPFELPVVPPAQSTPDPLHVAHRSRAERTGRGGR